MKRFAGLTVECGPWRGAGSQNLADSSLSVILEHKKMKLSLALDAADAWALGAVLKGLYGEWKKEEAT